MASHCQVYYLLNVGTCKRGSLTWLQTVHLLALVIIRKMKCPIRLGNWYSMRDDSIAEGHIELMKVRWKPGVLWKIILCKCRRPFTWHQQWETESHWLCALLTRDNDTGYRLSPPAALLSTSVKYFQAENVADSSRKREHPVGSIPAFQICQVR